jgi:leader peptidase (prepilin peptidase)/N-methyltransferase
LTPALLWPGGGALLGAIIGSFLGALVLRWPRGASVVRGRSCCDACGAQIAARDLIPILSFLLRRGRCRACGGAIERTHFWIELTAALIGGVAFALFPPIQAAAFVLLGWLLLPLAWIDARHHWLPDPLVGALALAGLLLGELVSGADLLDRLIGAVAGGLSLALIAEIYRRARGRDGLGGGDPKLFAALGCWLGWALLPPLLLVASALGLVWAGVEAARGRLLSATTRLPLGTLLALAVPIALAVWPLVLGIG